MNSSAGRVMIRIPAISASRFAVKQGLLLERKPSGFALHFRQAPEQADQVIAHGR